MNASLRGRLFLGALGFWAALGAAPAVSREARADDKAECVEAYTSGQRLRKENKLGEAHEKFLACSQDRCSAVLRQDCTQWLGEVEQALPSIVVAATGADGAEIVDVRVQIDGKATLEKLDGKSIALDPGPHTLRCERAGSPAVEREIIAKQGEKNRRITLVLGAAGEGPSAARKIAPFAVGGIGLVGIAVFAGLGISGMSDKSELEKTCAPSCPEERVNDIRTKLLAADVSLGIGIASLAVSAVLFLTMPKTAPSAGKLVGGAPSVDVVASDRGAALVLRGAF